MAIDNKLISIAGISNTKYYYYIQPLNSETTDVTNGKILAKLDTPEKKK